METDFVFKGFVLVIIPGLALNAILEVRYSLLITLFTFFFLGTVPIDVIENNDTKVVINPSDSKVSFGIALKRIEELNADDSIIPSILFGLPLFIFDMNSCQR